MRPRSTNAAPRFLPSSLSRLPLFAATTPKRPLPQIQADIVTAEEGHAELQLRQPHRSPVSRPDGQGSGSASPPSCRSLCPSSRRPIQRKASRSAMSVAFRWWNSPWKGTADAARRSRMIQIGASSAEATFWLRRSSRLPLVERCPTLRPRRKSFPNSKLSPRPIRAR